MRYWFGAYSLIYNKCVYFSKRVPHLRKYFRLRKLLVFNNSIWVSHNAWLKYMPANIRQAAYQDFQKALESNLAKKYSIHHTGSHSNSSPGKPSRRVYSSELEISLEVGRKDVLQDPFRRNEEKVHWSQRNLLYTTMRPRL
eukprot:NODE_738_length_4687_cov_0.308849.p5 type:complete len:141 gc:universal NODE_738_length_4687_cov_0.308849:3525-3103(-)